MMCCSFTLYDAVPLLGGIVLLHIYISLKRTYVYVWMCHDDAHTQLHFKHTYFPYEKAIHQ